MGLFSDDEAAQMDMIEEHLKLQEGVHRHQEAGRGRSREWLKTKLPVWMSKLEKCLGGKLSWADVELFTFLTAFSNDLEGAAVSFAACPKSQKSVELILFDHPELILFRSRPFLRDETGPKATQRPTVRRRRAHCQPRRGGRRIAG